MIELDFVFEKLNFGDIVIIVFVFLDREVDGVEEGGDFGWCGYVISRICGEDLGDDDEG